MNEMIEKFTLKNEQFKKLKLQKANEFLSTIKGDLNELLSNEEISKIEINEYFRNLESILREKEIEMDNQIKVEQDKDMKDLLIKFSVFLNSQCKNEFNISDFVIDNGMNFLEISLKSLNINPVDKGSDLITMRLNKILPDDNYIKVSNSDILSELKTIEPVKTVKPTPVVEKKPKPIVKPIEVKPAPVAPKPVVEKKPVAVAPKEVKSTLVETTDDETAEKVSTLDLEKLLAEVQELI